MIDYVDTMKVLSFSEDSARIYYMQINKEWGFWKSGSRGNILTFEKESGEWEEVNWEDWAWDDSLLWPYIYHSPMGVIYIILWAVLFSIFLVKTIVIVKSERQQKN